MGIIGNILSMVSKCSRSKLYFTFDKDKDVVLVLTVSVGDRYISKSRHSGSLKLTTLPDPIFSLSIPS